MRWRRTACGVTVPAMVTVSLLTTAPWSMVLLSVTMDGAGAGDDAVDDGAVDEVAPDSVTVCRTTI